MKSDKSRVCPVELAASLDNRFRRWFQDPKKILGPFIREGMKVLDLGCGPGYFTVDIAQMVGDSGKVFAADLQEGMLQKLKSKIANTSLENRVILHLCEEAKIGLDQQVDFVLAFYVVHEIPRKEPLFEELYSTVRPGGEVLIVEPPFHVSKTAFRSSLEMSKSTGFEVLRGPKIFLHRTSLLRKGKTV
jgi:ubiquinone/menaquinone biosynthesis C-methylase UbiE